MKTTKQFFIVVLFSLTVLIPSLGQSQYKIRNTVLGSGFSKASNENHRIRGTFGQSLIGQSKNLTEITNVGFWRQLAAAIQSSAVISLPDTFAAQNFGTSIPLTVETDSTIGFAQFVLEYDSTLVSFEMAEINSEISGFIVSQVNESLPFPPTNSGVNANVLIQVSGDGNSSFTGNKNVVNVFFSVFGPLDSTAQIYFDQTANHTFLTTTNLNEIDLTDISFTNGKILILAPKFTLQGQTIYNSTLVPVPKTTITVQGIPSEETDENGMYVFSDLVAGSYTLTAEKNGDIGSSISGSDGLALLRHLSFVQSLNENQQIAADVTQDGTISGSDAMALLRFLAFFSDNIGQTGNWVFSPIESIINGPPDVIQDFIATILGDVTPDFGNPAPFAKPSSQILAELSLPERLEMYDNNTFIIPVSIATDSSIGLVQFVLEYDTTFVSFKYVKVNPSIAGFSISSINESLPFAPMNHNSNKGLLIQVSGGGANFFTGEKKIVEINFTRIYFDNENTNLPFYFNRTKNATFLTTSNLTDISGNDILYKDGQLDVITGISDSTLHLHETRLPTNFALYQNYPNPFNPSTIIKYDLPIQASVVLEIYNLLGQKVRILVDSERIAGSHRVQWDGRDDNDGQVPNGIYIYKLSTKEFSQVKKLTLIR